MIIREKFRNIPDQGKRAEALNVFAREQRQRLAADPSLTPRQRFINQSVLDQYLTQLEGQMQKDGIQTQIETERVNMGNTVAAISARALSGEADAAKSITDAAAAINGAAQWLSPAELNKAAQDAFAGIGQSLIEGHLTKLLEDSAGNPIANTAALEAQFQGIYSRMIGAAGEMLGEDRLDILRVQAAESLSKARQGLQEHSADFFRGVQARYENALAQGDEGTAAALQRAYAGTPAQAIRRGDLRDRDALSMSGYLKPVVPRGDGTGSRNIAAAGQVTAAMEAIRGWYAGLGGLPAAEAAERIPATGLRSTRRRSGSAWTRRLNGG